MAQNAEPRHGRASEALPPAPPPHPRAIAAWSSWLRALANDAQAALAAALAYESLDGISRDRWLDALDEDAPGLEVPRIALYAPLLSVEQDPLRSARIRSSLGSDEDALLVVDTHVCALRGLAADGTRVVVFVRPLYLSFVQVFGSRFHLTTGFCWARHEPLMHREDAPYAGSVWEGVWLEETPLKPVVEELAHAILAQRRCGAPLPDSLRVVIDLFRPELELDDGSIE